MRQNSQKYRKYNQELYNNRIKRSLWAVLSMGIGLFFAYLTISDPQRGNFNPKKKKKKNINNFVELKIDKISPPSDKNRVLNSSPTEKELLKIGTLMIDKLNRSDKLDKKEREFLIKILEYSKFKPFSSKNYIANWYIKDNTLYSSKNINKITRVLYEIKFEKKDTLTIVDLSKKIIKRK